MYSNKAKIKQWNHLLKEKQIYVDLGKQYYINGTTALTCKKAAPGLCQGMGSTCLLFLDTFQL